MLMHIMNVIIIGMYTNIDNNDQKYNTVNYMTSIHSLDQVSKP